MGRQGSLDVVLSHFRNVCPSANSLQNYLSDVPLNARFAYSGKLSTNGCFELPTDWVEDLAARNRCSASDTGAENRQNAQ